MPEEKQFEPTQSRLERAKREGDVARSQELAGVAAFAAALLAVCAILGPLAGAARSALTAASSGEAAMAALAQMLALMLAPVACAACAAVLCSMLQNGGVRFAGLSIKTNRLNPAENLKRMLSKEAVITAVRASIAFLCAGAALVPAFIGIFARTLHASGVAGLGVTAWSGAVRTAACACAVGAIFAGADYAVQYARWRKRLRMSHEELRRDQKEHDGDPLARSRRRALHRQIARGSLRRIKDAAFVVTNPTHIAIALAYRPPAVPVPRVLVRAADEAAARVRDLAAAHGIPLVENVPLARLLYASASAGDVIPQETYIAVAEIVAALAKGAV
jgi:flagellar biosynthesis protein FlhB